MQSAPKVLRRRKTQKIGDTMEKFLETFAGMVRIATPPEYAELAAEVLKERPVIIPQDVPDRHSVAKFEQVQADRESLYSVTYTSGSSGRPKGVPNVRRIGEDRWQRPLTLILTH